MIHIQPDEGISLSFGAKIPGAHVRLGDVKMDFHYADYFGTEPQPGYERLLYDCMIGDATLFQRADMVEAGWSVVEPVIDVWRALPHATSRITRQEAGDRKRPMNCSHAMAGAGERNRHCCR